LGGVLAEHEAIKGEVSALREMIEERRRAAEAAGFQDANGSERQIRSPGENDDDNTRSINTILNLIGFMKRTKTNWQQKRRERSIADRDGKNLVDPEYLSPRACRRQVQAQVKQPRRWCYRHGLELMFSLTVHRRIKIWRIHFPLGIEFALSATAVAIQRKRAMVRHFRVLEEFAHRTSILSHTRSVSSCTSLPSSEAIAHALSLRPSL
jgi:hypothetical protein